MKYLDLSFSGPAQNLACDEALLDWCEAGADCEILRLWEPSDYFVVLGYANKASLEVNLEACRERNIPVLRRCSGGGTVVQGPGCLNYSLVLRMDDSGLSTISGTNNFVMRAHQQALATILNAKVEIDGHTDLAIGGRKFSGNSQRRKRRYLLFHGSFLLNFDLPLIQDLLPPPSKQPAYRRRRSHLDFLKNLNIPPNDLKEVLKKTWTAHDELHRPPTDLIEKLAKEKYSEDAWTLKFA